MRSVIHTQALPTPLVPVPLGSGLRNRCSTGSLDLLAEPVRDLPVALLGGVLVDQCSPHRRVTHARHQLLGGRSGGGSQVITGVPQVVEMHGRGIKRAGLAGLPTTPSTSGPGAAGGPSRPRAHGGVSSLGQQCALMAAITQLARSDRRNRRPPTHPSLCRSPDQASLCRLG